MDFAQFIPQLFYDLIGRLVAGLSLLGTVYLVWQQEILSYLIWTPGKDEPSWLFLSLVLLLAAYILALVLEGLWSLILQKWVGKYVDERAKVKARGQALKEFSVVLPTFDCEHYKFPGVPIMYDILRLKDPNVGARLVKLRAEIQLCRTLALGWSIIMAFWLAYPGTKIGQLPGVLGLLTCVVAVSSEYWSRRVRTYWSMYNHWLILEEAKLPSVYSGRGDG